MTGMRGPDLPSAGGIDSFIVNFDPGTGADVFRAPASLVASSLGPIIDFQPVPSNVYHEDLPGAKPRVLKLGDRQRSGFFCNAAATTTITTAGSWGSDYKAEYLWRDAQFAIGQEKGGYGLVAVGRNSDYPLDPANYRVSTGIGIFQIADSDAGATTNLAGGIYSEILKFVANTPCVGYENNIGNLFGPPPTMTPYQPNNPGSLICHKAGTDISKSDWWIYANSAAYMVQTRVSAFLGGFVVGRGSIAGSNGLGTTTMNITSVVGQDWATVDDFSKVTVGQYVNDARFGGVVIVIAVQDPNKVRFSAPAAVGGTGSIDFRNLEAEAIWLPSGSPGYAIRWENPGGAKGAFIRADLTTSQTSVGQIFYSGGVAFVDVTGFPGAETTIARIDKNGRYWVSTDLLVGGAKSGWGAPSGPLSRSAFASHAAPTISASYTQSEVQTIANRLATISQTLAALLSDLHAATSGGGHGLLKA